MALEKFVELESGSDYSYIRLIGGNFNFTHGSSYVMEGWKDETYRRPLEGEPKPPVHGSKMTHQLTEEENLELKELVAAFFYEKAKSQPVYRDAKDLI